MSNNGRIDGAGAAETSLETEIRDCVVIGGGIAGLAAARDLQAKGVDFVLLEAGAYECGGGCRCRGHLHNVQFIGAWECRVA